jgi:hypothetical protein
MSNRYSVLWVKYQNHVCDLSNWGSPSSLTALFAGLCVSLALRLATFASWFFLFPRGVLGLPCGWLTVLVDRPHRGYCVPHTRDTSGVGALTTRGEIRCPRIQRHRLYALLKEHLVPSLFSRHHRLGYPRSDDFFLRSLIKGSLAFTRPLFTRGRFRFVAKLPLRHYSWLRTLLLPGTHAGVGDSLGH